jgi:subtilisin family serine protease
MSFAGPADPRLREALQKANARGIVLVAAAGNAGPKSPPLYPAADSIVIAVTATNAQDALFSGANRGGSERRGGAVAGTQSLAHARRGAENSYGAATDVPVVNW